jgi:2-polyprenyl-3-methyl-5-hydroxy-6-metoxy-1,4-benzoquinol methylase
VLPVSRHVNAADGLLLLGHEKLYLKGDGSMSVTTPEMESLKTRLKAMWMTGDFGEVAKHIETGAEEFIARLALEPNIRLLDVACGSGNLAIPAARAGAIVTGVTSLRTYLNRRVRVPNPKA